MGIFWGMLGTRQVIKLVNPSPELIKKCQVKYGLRVIPVEDSSWRREPGMPSNER